jgi:hypothetical protein
MSRTESECKARQGKSIFFFYHRKERGKGIGILDGTLKRELASLGNCIVLVLHCVCPSSASASCPAVVLRLGLCKLINGTYLPHMPTPRSNSVSLDAVMAAS